MHKKNCLFLFLGVILLAHGEAPVLENDAMRMA